MFWTKDPIFGQDLLADLNSCERVKHHSPLSEVYQHILWGGQWVTKWEMTPSPVFHFPKHLPVFTLKDKENFSSQNTSRLLGFKQVKLCPCCWCLGGRGFVRITLLASVFPHSIPPKSGRIPSFDPQFRRKKWAYVVQLFALGSKVPLEALIISGLLCCKSYRTGPPVMPGIG